MGVYLEDGYAIKVELKITQESVCGNKIDSVADVQKFNSPSEEDLLKAFMEVLWRARVRKYSCGDRLVIKSEDIPSRSTS